MQSQGRFVLLTQRMDVAYQATNLFWVRAVIDAADAALGIHQGKARAVNIGNQWGVMPLEIRNFGATGSEVKKPGPGKWVHMNDPVNARQVMSITPPSGATADGIEPVNP